MENFTTSTSQETDFHPVSLASLEKVMEELKNIPKPNNNKLIVLCKKHYKAFQKQVIGRPPVYYFSIVPFDLNVHFLIKPYAKKIRIFDIPEFEFRKF